MRTQTLPAAGETTTTSFFSKKNSGHFFTPAGHSFFKPSGALSPDLQLSPLSDQADASWTASKDKGKIFDILRSNFPVTKSDADLRQCIERLFAQGTDDRWLASTILDNGPEPLWPGNLLAQRQQLAQQHQWGDEPGHIQGTLGTTAGGRSVDSFFFPGKTDNRALIVGGFHGSELSGIAVTEILLEKLRTGPRPFYTVIIVPRLFPDNAAVAEGKPKQIETGENVGRYTKGTESTDHSTDPNREMPKLGKAYDPAVKKDAKDRPMEPEEVMLLELIDRYRPTRIAAIHSTHTLNDAGIYADPRTDSSGFALGYDTDKALALEMAKKANEKGANVPGNKLGTKNETGLYPLDKPIVDAGKKQERATSTGISLGGWGSTAVCDPKLPASNRPAMRVITVEVQQAYRPQDLDASKQAVRQAELEAHAQALREIFLGDVQTEAGSQDPCVSAAPPPPPVKKPGTK